MKATYIIKKHTYATNEYKVVCATDSVPEALNAWKEILSSMYLTGNNITDVKTYFCGELFIITDGLASGSHKKQGKREFCYELFTDLK